MCPHPEQGGISSAGSRGRGFGRMICEVTHTQLRKQEFLNIYAFTSVINRDNFILNRSSTALTVLENIPNLHCSD